MHEVHFRGITLVLSRCFNRVFRLISHLDTFDGREVDEVPSSSKEDEDSQVDSDTFRPQQCSLLARPVATLGGSPQLFKVTLERTRLIKLQTARCECVFMCPVHVCAVCVHVYVHVLACLFVDTFRGVNPNVPSIL